MKRTGLSVLLAALVLAAGASRPAAADDTTLSLQNGRFTVAITWAIPGESGPGHGVPLVGDSGYFWFFDAANVEVIVKVIDGCGLNQRFWVFAGGLTNVGTTMIVTDTQTGAAKTYRNPLSTPFQPLQDTDAFACP
jgi:hypothetical protein